MTDAPVPIGQQITPRRARKARAEEEEQVALPPSPEQQFAIVDPFEGKTTRVDGLTGLHHVNQLRDELAKAAELEPDAVQLALVLEDPYREAADDNVGILYISPAVDPKLAKKVLAAHEADEQYGQSDAQREWPVLKEKIQSGDELSSDEVARALRVLSERI